MALNKVTLLVDVGAGQGYYRGSGAGYFIPTAVLTDSTDHLIVDLEPIPVNFSAVGPPPQVQLLATDNANLLPSGWAWTFTPAAGSGVAAFSFFLPYASGATQYLSQQIPVSTVATMQTWGAPAIEVTQAQRVTTTSDLATQALTASTPPAFASVLASGPGDIVVDPCETYQQFLGVGAALTDSAAYVLTNYMSSSQRTALLKYLFSPSQCGWSMLRVCMGSQSFQNSATYTTYDDMPAGQTDTGLVNFSVLRSSDGGGGGDTNYIIPILQQILAINPGVRIIATVWNPPLWMLSSGSLGVGGEVLNTSYYAAYAQYYVQFIQAYQSYGIPIWAVTPANEPSSHTYLNLSSTQAISVIGGNLAEALSAAGLGQVKIFCLDDDWSVGTTYPEAVLGSSVSGPNTDGVAWHGYGGSPTVMSAVQGAYPASIQLQTEWRSLSSESVALQLQGMAGGYVAGGAQNFGAGFLLWNLALDQNGAPEQSVPGRIGAVTVNNGTGAVTYNAGFYALTHLSKLVQPGARRCTSTTFGVPYTAYTTYPSSVTTCAWVNPDGSVVLYAYNGSGSPQTFQVVDRRSATAFPVTMVSGELSTFTWGTTRQALPSAATAVPSAPGAPVLTATGGAGQVSLSWTTPSSAAPIARYHVKRSTTTGTEITLAEVPAGTTSYVDLTGASGTWFYTVNAVSAGGPGAASNEQTATATSPAAPAAPVIAATPAGTSITLTWAAPSANGAVITSYNILRSTSPGSETSLATASQGATTYTDTGLTVGTTYYYKINAVNSAGTSSNSNEASAAPTGVVIDAESTASSDANVNSGNVSSLTWNHATGTGANRLLLVYVGYAGIASPPRVSGVTYGGTALTKLLTADPSPGGGTDKALDVWYLAAPPSGTTAIVVTLSSQSSLVCAGVTAAGVSQSAPLGTPESFTSTSSNAPTVNTTGGASTDLVLAGLHMRGSNTVTPGGGQTDIVTYAQINSAANQLLVSKQAGGTGTITSSFSWTTADMAAEIAVALAAG